MNVAFHYQSPLLSSLLLARLMGQHCFVHWCLSSVVICNAAGGRSTAARPAAVRLGGRAADNAWRASMVTSRQGDTLLWYLWSICYFLSDWLKSISAYACATPRYNGSAGCTGESCVVAAAVLAGAL